MVLSPAVEAQTASAEARYNRGRELMVREDWYAAAESFLECLKLNAAHAEGTAALAECYYELGEFDQALVWVRKARSLSRSNMALANLEAFTLIALGQLDASSAVITEVLRREPYNKEALFAAAELDVAKGHTGDALKTYREVVRRFPDDRRVLVSLALVLGVLGDTAGARSSIERALILHSGDYRVYYYAAYLDSQAESLPQAIAYAEEALSLRPGYAPARSLLASLRYRAGQYEEAARLADEAIATDRNDTGAWYLKAMAYSRLGRSAEAIRILSTATTIGPVGGGDDEFVRTALEDLLINTTKVEDPGRERWAGWHFSRAREYRSRNLGEQALFEYRRGLVLNPYAAERRDYAELLRIRGYPSRYLEELKFMKDLGLDKFSQNEVRAINDAIEAYDSLLTGALVRRWSVEDAELARRHWKVAVFSVAAQSAFYHADAGKVASSYIRDLLVHDRNITAMNLPVEQSSFSQAFRTAREAGADYFLVLTLSENERDLSVKGELFVGRTGTPAGTFYTYRTGADRLRNASRGMVEQLAAALPFRGELLRRRAQAGLIDKGKADGVTVGAVYEVVKKGRPAIRNEGIALEYVPGDVAGTLVIDRVDEEVSSGVLTRNGFFDRIETGDEIILQKEKTEIPVPAEQTANPELRTLLRTLR
ncbi:hypothetical protein AGMMS50267_00050 [Spirochaetia bacterium]|nr:hypothetical protein AGMMS50267_00050 [Spirochaetia bacterium]